MRSNETTAAIVAACREARDLPHPDQCHGDALNEPIPHPKCMCGVGDFQLRMWLLYRDDRWLEGFPANREEKKLEMARAQEFYAALD